MLLRWRWVAGLMAATLALAALGGAAAQSNPGGASTATIEVTVWRSVPNPALLYLSTRPAGGTWRTEQTPLDMSALSTTGRFHQSNAIRVRVPLIGGGTATIEVTVWRSVSNPALLYLSTRPEGGRWRTEQTSLDMSALSRSGRFHQSNAVRVRVTLDGTPSATTPVPGDRGSCRIDEAMAARVIASTVKVITPTGNGSAFYIGNGQFVTAAHVVDDRPASITLRNERVDVAATLVGLTSAEGGDIAILTASAPSLTALTWAGALAPGATVAVVGYPLGQGLRASISRGIVSRVFMDSAGISQIQTDAPANPGNSGGPLVDACGRVAGVVSWKILRDNQGNATDGLAFVVGEPSLSSLLGAIRRGEHAPSQQPSNWVGRGQSGGVHYSTDQEGATIIILFSDQGSDYYIGLSCINNRLNFSLHTDAYWYTSLGGGTTMGYSFGASEDFIFGEWDQRDSGFFISRYPLQMMDRIRSERVLWIGLSDALDTEVRSFPLQGMTSTPAQGNLDRCGR